MNLPSVFLLCIAVSFALLVASKEIEATKEWQPIGQNDSIPAGMHVRMDLTTGEKWVKLPSEDDADESSAKRSVAAIVHPDGSLNVRDSESESDEGSSVSKAEYDFEMMHRTLSKLPPEEMERFGGLPQLPDGRSSGPSLTKKEREEFEARMAKIWEQRQAELKEVQEQLLDVPEVLKARMRGIKEYLKDPLDHLNSFSLEEEEEEDEGMVTHIISLLKDLEFQLTDVDNARDFHTMGGWELIVSLASEDVHVQNKTISKLSRNTEEKIRAVQSHSAWTIGTAVKNTGEFFPFAIEPVQIGSTTTTALDLLLDISCKDYKDDFSWPIRNLRGKSIYGLGALLRGNRLAQAHLLKVNGAARLSDRLQKLSVGGADIKLVQRLLSLASDLITDIQLDGDDSTADLNTAIVKAFSTPEWCQIVSNVLISEEFLPVKVQETVMETCHTLAPHCSDWKDKAEEHKAAIKRFWNAWEINESDFDVEHLNQLKRQATQLRKLL